jgi:hemerythrin
MGELLPWSESFAVGHGVIDGQHRELIRHINALNEAARNPGDPERMALLLKTLRRAVEDHFRTENSILWELRSGTYEGLKRSAAAKRAIAGLASTVFDDHIAEHTTLLERFEEIVRSPLELLGERLRSWFVDHAIKQDAHLKTIFQALP